MDGYLHARTGLIHAYQISGTRLLFNEVNYEDFEAYESSVWVESWTNWQRRWSTSMADEM